MSEKEGRGVAFVKGSATSTEAAHSMEPHVGRLAKKVYWFLLGSEFSGATDDEIEVALDLKHQTASARRRELELKGLVVKQYNHQHEHVKRLTRSKRRAGVYVLKAFQENRPATVDEPVNEDPRPVPWDLVPQPYRQLVDALQRLQFVAAMQETEFSGEGGSLPDGFGVVMEFRRQLNEVTDSVHKAARGVFRHLNPVLPKEETHPIAVYYKKNPHLLEAPETEVSEEETMADYEGGALRGD